MNLVDLKTLKALLREKNLRPQKKLGQHFLICQKVLEKVIKKSNLEKDDLVLEIGSGVGALTYHLCQKAGKVTAVELDPNLSQILKKTCGEFKNLEIINSDILTWDLDKWLKGYGYEVGIGKRLRQTLPKNDTGFITLTQKPKYKIVSSLPYQITSPVLWKFLFKEGRKPQEIVLIIQKEAAYRICSSVPKMNKLAVLVQFYGKPEIISEVSKNCFWPKPEVDSVILKITVNSKQLTVKDIDPKIFFRIVKAGFATSRKQLKNSLSGNLQIDPQKITQILKKSNIDLKRRAESLTLPEWQKLYYNLSKAQISRF